MAADFTKYSNFNRDANYESVRFGTGTKVLEVELNEMQNIQAEARAEIVRDSMPSGFTKLSAIDYTYNSTNPNKVKLSEDSIAYVNGYKIAIPKDTTIDIGVPPTQTPREDLVFLEVWKEEIDYTEVVDKAGQAGAGGVTNTLFDSRINEESARRVQLKYRLRAVAGVDFSTFPEGLNSISNWSSVLVNVTAQGGNAQPLTPTLLSGNGMFVSNQHRQAWGQASHINDTGLYVAGIGSEANKTTFKTVDGYVYAIPMFRVYRRPSTGYAETNEYNVFSPLTSPINTQRVVDNANVKHERDSLKVTLEGRTLVNLLGDKGNCEDIAKFDNVTRGTLDSTIKLFGSNSIKFTATGLQSFIAEDVACDQTHKYLVSAYAYLSAYTSGGFDINVGDMNAYSSYSSIGFDKTKLSQWQRKSLIVTGKLGGGMRVIVGGTGTPNYTAYIDGISVYDLTAMGLDTITDIPTLERMLPYVDGVQHSKPVAVKAKGKNLFDRRLWEPYIIGTDTDGYIFNNTVIRASLRIRNFKPNTQYTLSYKSKEPTASINNRFSFVYEDGTFSECPFTTNVLAQAIGTSTAGKTLSYIILNYSLLSSTFVLDLNSIQLEEGSVATAYQPYKASEVILPSIVADMKEIGTVRDTIDLQRGKLTKKISDWVTLDGSLAWANHSMATGYKVIYYDAGNGTVIANYKTVAETLVIKNTGIPLKYNATQVLTISDTTFFSSGNAVMIATSNTDTGFTDAYTPTANEWKAFMYGWKMCMSDGSAWDGVATKYWKKITDGTGITSVLPTASYAGYTPYKMIYQLATPVEYDINDLVKGRLYVNPELTTFEVNQVNTKGVVPVAQPNLVTNGDFSNGTTGWVNGSSTSAVSNGILSNTGDGSATSALISYTTAMPLVLGKKIYARTKARVTNSDCTNLLVQMNGTTGGTNISSNSLIPTPSVWHTLSVIGALTDQVGSIAIRVRHYYADNATANGKVMEVQQVLLADLTAIFGAGNEPSQAWCDKYLEFGTNYTAKSPTGTTALGIQRASGTALSDSFLGVQGNVGVIPATKYKDGVHEIFYRDPSEAHVPPRVTLVAGALTTEIKDGATVGSMVLTNTEVPYKKHTDGANAYLKADCSSAVDSNSGVVYSSALIMPIGTTVTMTFSSAIPSNYVIGARLYRVSGGGINVGKIVAIDSTTQIKVYVDSVLVNFTWSANNSYYAMSRPDALLADIVADLDVTDLRHQVSLTGFSYEKLLLQEWDRFARSENTNY